MQTIREVFESSGHGVPLNGALDKPFEGTIGIARETDDATQTEYVLVFVGTTLIARFLWANLPVMRD